MFNKILIGVGFLLSSILIIENMVMGAYGLLFLDRNTNVGIILIISIIIGIGMGFGARGIIYDRNNPNEDIDNDF